MKITEITDKATVKMRSLVNAFHHNHDLDFVEVKPNVFALDKEYYVIKIYGSSSVKVSIHCIGDKRDKLFTCKNVLECAKEVANQVKKIEDNITFLQEIFIRLTNCKEKNDIKINVDKKKGIVILGKNQVKIKLGISFTAIDTRILCEWPGRFYQRETAQVIPSDIDYFIVAVSTTCSTGDYMKLQVYDDVVSARARRELNQLQNRINQRRDEQQ